MQNIRDWLNITTKRDRIRATICSAVRSRRIIEFYYHGGYRTVEPFCLGVVLSGGADNESLVCYQIGGFSELREVVGWKLYRASEMEDIEISNEQFSGDRPGYDPDDMDMAVIRCYVTPVKAAPKAAAATAKVELREPEPKNLTHNELMRRFRFTHPIPIPELYTRVLPGPPVKPLPERVESKFTPLMQLFGSHFTWSVKPARIWGTDTDIHYRFSKYVCYPCMVVSAIAQLPF